MLFIDINFIHSLSITVTEFQFRVLQSLESFQDKAILSVFNENSTSSEMMEATFAFPNFAIQIQEIDQATYQGQTFTVNLGPVEDTLNITNGIPDDSLSITNLNTRISTDDHTASVQLPRDLLNSDTCKISDLTGQSRFSYSVFLSDIFFQSETQPHLELGSLIVAPRTRCGDDVILKAPITVSFRTNRMHGELC